MDNNSKISQSVPPAPPKEDRARIETTARRLRMLSGAWKSDARDHIARHYARETLEYLPPPSISRCPFKNLVGQTSTLYDAETLVEIPFGDPSILVTTRLRALWPQNLAYVNGLNESFIRIDRLKTGRIAYRAVTPDCVSKVVADEEYPDIPVALTELRWLKRKGFEGWAYEVWSVEDLDNPVFQVLEVGSEGKLIDATQLYLPESGYPMVDLDGKPFLPYTLYHQKLNGRLFNPQDGEEAIDGSLDVAMWSTCINQAMRDLAYPQRVIIDAELVGTTQGAQGTGAKLTISPLSVIQLRSINGLSGRIDAWQSSFDATKSVSGLDMVESAVNSFAGLTAADMNVSAASSGAARVISKEGLRRVRLARELTQRMGDQDLLSRASRLYNAGQGSRVLPEDPEDWKITYQELHPLDAKASPSDAKASPSE